MAITYTLDTASSLDSIEVSALLARLPDFTRTDEGMIAPDVQIWIDTPTPLSASIVEEAFEFLPRLQIYFRLDNLGDGPAAVDRVLMATATLLRETQADTSLLMNGEHVILTRLHGRLLLNSIPRLWTDARVKMMPEPNAFTDPRIL